MVIFMRTVTLFSYLHRWMLSCSESCLNVHPWFAVPFDSSFEERERERERNFIDGDIEMNVPWSVAVPVYHPLVQLEDSWSEREDFSSWSVVFPNSIYFFEYSKEFLVGFELKKEQQNRIRARKSHRDVGISLLSSIVEGVRSSSLQCRIRPHPSLVEVAGNIDSEKTERARPAFNSVSFVALLVQTTVYWPPMT